MDMTKTTHSHSSRRQKFCDLQKRNPEFVFLKTRKAALAQRRSPLCGRTGLLVIQQKIEANAELFYRALPRSYVSHFSSHNVPGMKHSDASKFCFPTDSISKRRTLGCRTSNKSKTDRQSAVFFNGCTHRPYQQNQKTRNQ